MQVLGQGDYHVLPAKPVTKMPSSLSLGCHLRFLEPVQFYTAVDTTFQSLSMLLCSKTASAQPILAGISEVNVPIWLQFRQAFPQLSQHSL
jgi:hypothetical protein